MPDRDCIHCPPPPGVVLLGHSTCPSTPTGSNDASLRDRVGWVFSPCSPWVVARGTRHRGSSCVNSAELALCFQKPNGTPAKNLLGLHFHTVFLSDFIYLCFFMNQPSLPIPAPLSLFQLHFLFQTIQVIVPVGGYKERNDCFPSSLLQLLAR